MRKRIGIDLGASKIVVSAAGEGILSRENALVALSRENGAFLGIGGDTDRYYSLESEEVTLNRIFRDGIVVPDYTKAAIARCLSRYGDGSAGQVCLFMSIPCGFSEVEESALAEVAVQAGASECYLIYSPIAALAGSGIDLRQSSVIVDIGAARTNILTICHGRIFHKATFTAAGNGFDRAILDYLLEKHKVKISQQTAEAIKIKIGTVWVGNEKKYIDVRGRDATNGDYCTVRLCSDEMFTALEEPMAALIEGVCDAITKIPADCVQEVFDTGILLSGGGSLLDGLDKMISGVTGVSTALLNTPEDTVGLGLAALLAGADTPTEAGTLNITRYCMKKAAVPQRKG